MNKVNSFFNLKANFQVVDKDNEVLQNKYITVKNLVGKSLPSVPSTIKDQLETTPFLRVNNFELKKIMNMENESDENVFAELRKKRDIFMNLT